VSRSTNVTIKYYDKLIKLSLSVFYDDDDDVLAKHMTTLVDTPSSWVQLFRIPVSEVSNRVNMMFENPPVDGQCPKGLSLLS
jgi:hypothetical protein